MKREREREYVCVFEREREGERVRLTHNLARLCAYREREKERD